MLVNTRVLPWLVLAVTCFQLDVIFPESSAATSYLLTVIGAVSSAVAVALVAWPVLEQHQYSPADCAIARLGRVLAGLAVIWIPCAVLVARLVLSEGSFQNTGVVALAVVVSFAALMELALHYLRESEEAEHQATMSAR